MTVIMLIMALAVIKVNQVNKTQLVNRTGQTFETGKVIRILEEEDVDAIIPGEVIDWTVMSYIRDAVMLGKVKAAFNVGHFNLEELGMKYAVDWIPEVIGHAVPVHYVPSGDIYRFW